MEVSKMKTTFVINVPGEQKCTESPLDILLKIHDGQYKLVKKNKRSTVWHVYREIARPDGTKLKWKYYCLGCRRVMQSTGGTTSNLRIHKCHVRYLKQHGKLEDVKLQSPLRSRSPRSPITKKQCLGLDAYYDNEEEEYSDAEDDYEEPEYATNTTQPDIITYEGDESMELPINDRPLVKLFSEEESWSPDVIQEHSFELDSVTEEDHQQSPSLSPRKDFIKETIEPNSIMSLPIDATALSEAESYARAWAHAFLKLSENQKFYAKRSIDELLVLGRLERLNISTVTSLTTNL